MPDGKPAGVRCLHLSADNLCEIFNHPERPKVCEQFQADPWVCGETTEQALILLTELEQLTG